jgi:histidine triad (HIT) family protein
MPECIFCKIVQKEVPSQIAYEDDEALAFHDIHPQAPVHIQIIPKRHIARVLDLTQDQAHLVGKLVLIANRLARELGIADEGYRLVINCNPQAGQSVYHLHLHILGGRPMRWPPG